ncbi:MAG TPA: ABC transporter ATP-binding protein [Candidatus Limnocylindrales bacterium]|nr:ABC transporter ATP-binding protein [Candidatus Limnocylindrales bacterium]
MALGEPIRDDGLAVSAPEKLPMLAVDGVTVGYTNNPVLHGVSFAVGEAEVIAIVGPNGAGKSTTLRTISGLLKPWSGEIRLGDQRLGGLPPADVVRRGISHVPEGRRIFPGLSVLDNLRMGAYLERDRTEINRRLEYVFDVFPVLAERRRQVGTTLSGGEQQMLAVGRALMSRPQVLLLDEPSMGLAPLLVKRLFETLRRLQESGLAILLVEQNTRLALSVAHRIFVLSAGRVVAGGLPQELEGSEALRTAYLGGVPTPVAPRGEDAN